MILAIGPTVADAMSTRAEKPRHGAQSPRRKLDRGCGPVRMDIMRQRSADTNCAADLPAQLRRSGIVLLILTVATACVMGRCRGYQFIGWDDDYHVSQNPDLNPPSLGSIAKYWADPQFGLYIPVVFTAWAALRKSPAFARRRRRSQPRSNRFSYS